VFERGLKAIPLSVDLWIHFLNYSKATYPDDEEHIRAQFEKAVNACGMEFRHVGVNWKIDLDTLNFMI
jgi:pre-mRNA-processing factor 39